MRRAFAISAMLLLAGCNQLCAKPVAAASHRHDQKPFTVWRGTAVLADLASGHSPVGKTKPMHFADYLAAHPGARSEITDCFGRNHQPPPADADVLVAPYAVPQHKPDEFAVFVPTQGDSRAFTVDPSGNGGVCLTEQ